MYVGPCLDFYVGARDMNSGHLAWAASSLTHYTFSVAPHLILGNAGDQTQGFVHARQAHY